MEENRYAQRIELLRSMMRSRGWDAVVVTGSDPHSSEYPSERWKQVQWLTGFTGEAGDVVVTLDHAGLWTDTRYFIQAVNQLQGTGVELHKTRIPEQELIPDWLVRWFEEEDGVTVAVDGLCQTVDGVNGICTAFEDAGRSEDGDPSDGPAFNIVSMPDMLERLWDARPAIPDTPVFTADCGESRVSKLEWLRSWMDEAGCDSILLSSLDEIAWLLNVRASDIEYNPLVISYLIVSSDSVRWFVRDGMHTISDPQTRATFDILSNEGVEILPYSDISMNLSFLGFLLVDPSTLNYELFSLLGDAQGTDLLQGSSPVPARKAIKNEYEIEGMKRAHLLDGVAMEKFLFWLENAVREGNISEWDASVQLGEYRSEIDGYMGDSFETISAWGSGAALPHYVTPRRGAPLIQPHGLYLCDSGGQFTFGTTDITRTVPMGECSQLEKEDYTLVLKGHIALAMAVFPEGTPGCRLDALAREPLWRFRRNFGHGTGHGVGFFLGVHEGPQDIRQNLNDVPLEAGMITSNEPGIYREGKHGVRHENLVLCVGAGTNEFGSWLEFETLTLCHFDTSALLPELLSSDEKAWLNAYNEHVYQSLWELLPEDVAQWLYNKTRPI